MTWLHRSSLFWRRRDRKTYGPTDGRADRPGYRDARTHLKKVQNVVKTNESMSRITQTCHHAKISLCNHTIKPENPSSAWWAILLFILSHIWIVQHLSAHPITQFFKRWVKTLSLLALEFLISTGISVLSRLRQSYHYHHAHCKKKTKYRIFVHTRLTHFYLYHHAHCKTRPIRPTMRPHDDEMIVWWCDYSWPTLALTC